MLFKERFHDGMRDGSITLTFRAWKTPRATAGKSYRFGRGDAIEVESVDSVSVGDISAAEIRNAGFEDRDGLVDTLRRAASGRVTSRSKVYRIAFRYAGRPADPRVARRGDTSDGALDEIEEKLSRTKRPWAPEVLRLIERYPRVRAADLAQRLGRETRAFKRDVRRLKELGLTISHEVGYELSPRGRALLARWRR